MPQPCDLARARLDAAGASFAEGRLKRALARVARAVDQCPEIRGEAAALRARITAALDDPGEDAGSVAPAADQARVYHAAARAHVEGRMAEAEKGALAAALVKGELTAESAILAARSAQARGDEPRARRWFARAHHAACAGGCALMPRAPRSDLFAWAAAHAGFRSFRRSCLGAARQDPPLSALSPDGRVVASPTPAGIALRAVPSRVLLRDLPLKSSQVVCFNDSARMIAVDAGDRTMHLGPLEGPHRVTEVPHPTQFGKNGIVGRDGSAFFPSFVIRDQLDRWYRASPGDRSAHRIPLPTPWIQPLLLADGSLVGFEGKPDQIMNLARFDASRGTRRGTIAKTDNSTDLAETPDGSRIVYPSGESLVVIDLAARRVQHHACSRSAGILGLTRAKVFAEHDLPPSVAAQDLTSGALSWAGVIDHFTVFARAGRRALVALPEGVLAVDLASGALTRYPLGAGAPDPQHPLDLSRPAISDDGAWLVLGDDRRTSIYDVRDPARPVEVKRYDRAYHDAAFAPGSAVVHIRMRATEASRAYDAAARVEVPFDDRLVDAPEARVRERVEALGQLPARGEPCGFDDATSTAALCSSGSISLVRRIDGRLESVRLTITFGRVGAMVIDDQGFFEFVGDIPDAFRAAAACGDELPIEVCADRFEAKGMLARFLRGDVGYRDP
ncbi:MAG: hypothetical protein QM820_32440 [Minicystis sp.]